MREVIQVCRTDDGVTVVDCRYIPAGGLSGTGATMSLAELMPIIAALVGAMAVAWGFRHVVDFLIYQR